MSTATVAAAAPRTYKDVWLICIGHAMTHWYVATFYLLLPLIGRELGLSYTQIGLIMTTQHLVGAFANLPGGMIVDMVGQKGYLLAAALFWIGVPYALMSLTHEFWPLLMCVTLVSIGNNIWHPAAIPTLAYRYPKRKGLILSFHGMGGNIGEALAPLAIGSLLAWYSWRTVVVINVVPGIVMSVVILMVLGAFGNAKEGDSLNEKAHKKTSAREYFRGVGSLMRNRTLTLIFASSAMRTITQAGLVTFLPVYLAYELNYSPFAVGACMTVLQLAGFLAGPVGGHLSDKIGRRRVIMSSMVLSGIMLVGMVFAGKSLAFVVFVALVGFFLYGMRAVLQAWAVETTPKHLAASGVSLQFLFQGLGGSVAPVVFGMIADATNIYYGFYFLAATVILANVIVIFIPANESSTAPAPAAAH